MKVINKGADVDGQLLLLADCPDQSNPGAKTKKHKMYIST
jgi:hypothetical protein